ncbi:glycosyltransferase family 2 protein [Mumia sp. ZJ1417]|uniref:glycosyltransferase family 2 protein n=1 Tax=Mumia sp. ZJ1417 TaxID=2708082 RepID=UPI0014220432|nr:glycosyltransferase family 2 protein [Mumia sp. ZJ1417]QMW65582.1 glycosyltransferase family 2 protein [Mumia sp. ZJ1417]
MIEGVDEGLVPSRNWLAAPPSVTAVIVCRNGAGWLPLVLDALASLAHLPQAVVAVDVSSTDQTREILARYLHSASIRTAPPGTGFGDAVRVALEGSAPTDWVWLLHDDSAPGPDALAHLLDQATQSEDIGIAGPKLREWPSLKRLLEVGVTISGTGARETGLERGEPDQGQHDRPRDVLAVSTAGMLVRRRVLEDLGGFDPRLPLFFDDIDLGWRAARRGYRVRVAPSSVFFHVEAAATGLRPGSLAPRPRREMRRAATYTLLANASRPGFFWQSVRLFLGTLLRALVLLLAKAPREAADEIFGVLAVYRRPFAMLAARRRRAAAARVDARSVRERLLPSPLIPYRHGLDALGELVNTLVGPAPEMTGRRAAVELRPEDDDEELPTTGSYLSRHPWLTTMLVLTLVAFVASRSVIGSGFLMGGALLPAPDGAGAWWSFFTAGSHDVSIGSDVPAPGYVVPLALLATLLGGNADLAVSIVVLAGALLAALTAHRLGRRLFASPGVRLWWGATYGLLVATSGALVQGRIGTVVALAAAPAIVNSAYLLMTRPRVTDGLRLGLWLTLATAFAPVTYLLAAGPLLVAGAILLRRRGWPSIATALLLPWLLLGSWMWRRALDPGAWWWEAGRANADVGDLDPPTWQLALGHAGGPGIATYATAGLLLLGVLALLRRETRSAVLVAWATGLWVLGWASFGAGATFTDGISGGPVWVGVPATLWIAALAAAAGSAADGLHGRLADRPVRRRAFAVLVVLALVGPAVALTWWAVRGDGDPLERGTPDEIPAYLAARAEDGRSTLVLTGTREEGVTQRVVSGDGTRLGDEAVMPSPEDLRSLDVDVRLLLSNPSTGVLERLGSYGIQSIYLPAPADPDLVDALEAAPGLEPSGSPEGSRVWTFTVAGEPHEPPSSAVRPWVARGQLALLLVAVVVAAPGRAREVR